MPIHRGDLDDEEDTAEGGILRNLDADVPDDGIVVDLTKDEKSLNWMKYGPQDTRERFHQWSDEKAQKELKKAREKLREVRTDTTPESSDE